MRIVQRAPFLEETGLVADASVPRVTRRTACCGPAAAREQRYGETFQPTHRWREACHPDWRVQPGAPAGFVVVLADQNAMYLR